MSATVIFDLDNTLMDTDHLKGLRDARKWRDVRTQMASSAPFADVRHAVELLRKHQFLIAVVTHSPRWYASALLERHALAHDLLLAYHDLRGNLKPSPFGYQEAIRRLATDRCVVIGDEERDLLAADRTPCPAVVAGWGRSGSITASAAHARGWHFAVSPVGAASFAVDVMGRGI